VVDLRIAPVAKQIGDAAVRTLGYNGSIAGPASPRPALTPPRRHGDRLLGRLAVAAFAAAVNRPVTGDELIAQLAGSIPRSSAGV